MTSAMLTPKAIRSGIRIPPRWPWCQPRGTSATTRGRPHGTPGSAARRLGSPGSRGGWGCSGRLGAESPETGRRASCPRLAVSVLVVMAFLLTTTNGDHGLSEVVGLVVCVRQNFRHFCIQQTNHQRCQPHGIGGAVLRSSAGGGLPGRFHHPGPEWPEPARHGASAPCLGAAWGSLQESNIDDRVHIPVMLDTALAARRPRFRLQHWIVAVEGLASPAIRGRQPGSGTLTSRRGTL